MSQDPANIGYGDDKPIVLKSDVKKIVGGQKKEREEHEAKIAAILEKVRDGYAFEVEDLSNSDRQIYIQYDISAKEMLMYYVDGKLWHYEEDVSNKLLYPLIEETLARYPERKPTKAIRAELKDHRIFLTNIDYALKHRRVYFSWKSEYQWQFYVYKRKRYYYVRADADGRIQTCATMDWDRFKDHIRMQKTPPRKSNLETPKDAFKEELQSKVGLSKKQYLELYQKGELSIGGGMTTEMSFTKTASGSGKEDMDYIERVLSPKSSGYFIFNF